MGFPELNFSVMLNLIAQAAKRDGIELSQDEIDKAVKKLKAAQDYLKLEGGEQLVEFILRTAAIPDDEQARWLQLHAKTSNSSKDNNAPPAPQAASANGPVRPRK